jgi:phenylalanyl-tRNA synthetase alpha chain
MSSSVQEVKALLEQARAEGMAILASATDESSLDRARTKALGRKSPLSRARSSLGSFGPEDRKLLGQVANDVANTLEEELRRRTDAFRAAEREARWDRERVDVTLPGNAPSIASVHPLTRTTWRIVDIFLGLGYRVADGPEIELTKYNFDALNTPYEHPSRSPQDTYYIEGRSDLVLRTHTSPVQIRSMEIEKPPVYVVCPGRCYRRDELDPTHLNAFYQIEGLAIDVGITMGDLKGTLEVFAREMFGDDLDVRLRPSFFPFTEPSAEMDVQCFVCHGEGCRVCKGEGWIELMGCGMVDPFLLEWVGIDPERYTGFAFGMGVERGASLVHGVNDIRYFYENDLRFLRQFLGAG